MILLGFLGNLSGMDGIIILFILLLLFGAKRLPELARSLGSAVNEFNKAKEDVHRQITQAAEPPPVAPVAPPAASVPPVAGEPAAEHPLPPQQPPVA